MTSDAQKPAGGRHEVDVDARVHLEAPCAWFGSAGDAPSPRGAALHGSRRVTKAI